eukprot:403377056
MNNPRSQIHKQEIVKIAQQSMKQQQLLRQQQEGYGMMGQEINENIDLEEIDEILPEQIVGCYEYTQAGLYINNKKYEKALACLTQLQGILRSNQYQSPAYLLVLRRMYQCLIGMKRPRDAEVILMNIIEGISPKRRYQHDPKMQVLAQIDLLVHLINFQENSHQSSGKRLSTLAKKVLQMKEFLLLQGDEAAYTHLVIGLSFFLSEQVEYVECKIQLKFALTKATDPHLKSLILHNLAVLNYCEITDHNEKVLNPPSSIESPESLDALEKQEKSRTQKKQEDRKITLQLKKEERQKMMQERHKEIKYKLKMSAQEFEGKMNISKKNVNDRGAKILAKKMIKKEIAKQQYNADLIAQKQREVQAHDWKNEVDLLLNSGLPPNQLIQEPMKYGYQETMRRVDQSIALPRRTLESYYQMIVDQRLEAPSDLYSVLNEIQPLLFLSLKYGSKHIQRILNLEQQQQDEIDNEYSGNINYANENDPFLVNYKLDDFLRNDKKQKSLKNVVYYNSIEFLTRMYVYDHEISKMPAIIQSDNLNDLRESEGRLGFTSGSL